MDKWNYCSYQFMQERIKRSCNAIQVSTSRSPTRLSHCRFFHYLANFSVIIIKVLVFLNCYISIDFETFQGVLGAVKFGKT